VRQEILIKLYPLFGRKNCLGVEGLEVMVAFQRQRRAKLKVMNVPHVAAIAFTS
jgi:hypothetical protein